MGPEPTAPFDPVLLPLTMLPAAEVSWASPWQFCMNKRNWARRVELKDRPVAMSSGDHCVAAVSASASSKPPLNHSKSLVPAAASASASSSALGASRRFAIPIPGRDGPRHSLAGKTVVLSGIFPEVGGGKGLTIGKDKVSAMVESFGGRVTSAVSGSVNSILLPPQPASFHNLPPKAYHQTNYHPTSYHPTSVHPASFYNLPPHDLPHHTSPTDPALRPLYPPTTLPPTSTS